MTKFKFFYFLLMILLPLGAYAAPYINEVGFYDYNPNYLWYNSDYPNPFYGIYYYDLIIKIDNYSVTNDTAAITNGEILSVKTSLVEHQYKVNKITQKNYNSLITIKTNATRKGSKEVVDWVKAQLKASNIRWNNANMTASTNEDEKPKKLNFAVKVDLLVTASRNPSIRYICRNVILAQGHSPFYNNWWIFTNVDNSIDNRTPHTLSCYGGDIQVLSEEPHSFRFIPNN